MTVIPDGMRGASLTYASVFAATENPISESNRWINTLATGLDWANVRIVGGQAYGTQTGNGSDGLNQAPTKYDDSTAILSGTWSSAQMAEAVIFNNEISGNWNSEVEIRLRSTIAAHVNSGYEFNVRVKASATPYVEIIRWNGAIGDFTSLVHTDSAGFAVVTGDMIRALAVGNTLELWLRQSGVWTLCATTTDTTFPTGNPGMGFYVNNQGATGDPSRSGFTSFLARNLR